jgi:hypothetical protein
MLKAVREEIREKKEEFDVVNMNDPEVQNTHNYFKSDPEENPKPIGFSL